MVIDSTGLQLWRRGSPPGRTGWRKLHVAIDPNAGTILAEALTDGDVHDTQAVPGLVSRIDGRIGRVYGDGAYAGAPTYRLLADRRQALPIPQGVFRPRAPSIAVADEVDPLSQRGRHLRFPTQHGRRAWERDTGYGRRNLVEATFSRLERVLGNRLRGRSLPAQQSEASIVTRALNRMTELGMSVTGGSRGIGRGIAERLAKDGATVALTYNANKAGADETGAGIEASGGTAFALRADIADAGAIPVLFDRLDRELVERNGNAALDILVNNAGSSGWGGRADATPDAWDTMFAVHARAPFFMVQSALALLREGGRIVNISSGAGTRAMAAVPIYSMAKAAINNLTYALAIELGPHGVTVNAVVPGWVGRAGS